VDNGEEIEALYFRGMGLQHKTLIAFLLKHRKTLVDVKLEDCHTIVSAGPFHLTDPDERCQDYTKCVYGDWVECGTLFLVLQRQHVLQKLSLTFMWRCQ